MLINLLFALLGLSFLIVMHELGHYLTAVLFKIRVKRFSLGFGPTLLRFKAKSETEFVFSALLLGGYVQFETSKTGEEAEAEMGEEAEAEMGEEAEAEMGEATKTPTQNKKGRLYEESSPLIRMAILIAGPLTNALLAYLIYALILMIGLPGLKPVIGEVYPNTPAAGSSLRANDRITHVRRQKTETWQEVITHLMADIGSTDVPIRVFREHGRENTALLQLDTVRLADMENSDPETVFGMRGKRPQLEAHIREVLPDTPAERAGIRAGDKIIAAGGRDINSWEQFSGYIKTRAELETALSIERGGQQITIRITPTTAEDENGMPGGFVGLRVTPPSTAQLESYFVVSRSGLIPALQKASVQTGQMVRLIWRSFYELLIGSLSVKSLSGPVSIVKYTSDSAAAGLINFLSILAFISLSLFIFNLLPLPMLDGGQLVLCAIELVRGKALSQKFQFYYFRVGLAFFVSLFVFVTFNDITRFL